VDQVAVVGISGGGWTLKVYGNRLLQVHVSPTFTVTSQSMVI